MLSEARPAVKRTSTALAVAFSILIPAPAAASDWSMEASVGWIEPTYMPDRVAFTLAQGSGTCAAGSLLTWNARGSDIPSRIANTQAILSVLMTAQATGRKLRVYGNNAGCTIEFMHLLP